MDTAQAPAAGDAGRFHAGGLPLAPRVADDAADWLTLLMSGDATDDDRLRWRQWRAAHADHERAWLQMESVMGKLGSLQAHAAYQSLSPYATGTDPASGRRGALKALCWAGAGGAAVLLAGQSQPWRQLAADYRTGTGERRDIVLADGTRLALNTASAVNLRFGPGARELALVAGEILVTTGHAEDERRPFIVRTRQGAVRALGTRFAVRERGDVTEVAVQESAVEIAPAGTGAHPVRLRAGQAASFTATAVAAPVQAGEQTGAWARGMIVADDMRLDDFLAELGRHRSGMLQCDPAVAALRFSAVMPLGDTDAVLAMLSNSLPVRVRFRTRYWAMVGPEK